MTKLVGISTVTKEDGSKNSTLYILEDFEDYYNDENRIATGKKVDTVYVGKTDVSHLTIGATIEIVYAKAMITKNGSIYQPVREVKVISDKK